MILFQSLHILFCYFILNNPFIKNKKSEREKEHIFSSEKIPQFLKLFFSKIKKERKTRE